MQVISYVALACLTLAVLSKSEDSAPAAEASLKAKESVDKDKSDNSDKDKHTSSVDHSDKAAADEKDTHSDKAEKDKHTSSTEKSDKSDKAVDEKKKDVDTKETATETTSTTSSSSATPSATPTGSDDKEKDKDDDKTKDKDAKADKKGDYASLGFSDRFKIITKETELADLKNGNSVDTLLLFFKKSCTHCQAFIPELTGYVDGKKNDKIKYAAIDCDEHHELCKMVDEVPTLFMMPAHTHILGTQKEIEKALDVYPLTSKSAKVH